VAHRYSVVGHLVDAAYGAPGARIAGHPILGGFDWLAQNGGDVEVICAVGAPALRRRMVAAATTSGARFVTAVHPTAILTSRVKLGAGVAIAAGSILTTNISIGDHVHVNVGCTISHDCRLAEFVTVSPGAHIAGRAILDEGCFIGLGANVLEGRRIGAWSTVGAGATVIHDVPANATVVGVPARIVKSRPAGWHLP
jgi:sugar O-acyltransferase (sialic acid O-acetyltransferase NeuD family)